MMEYNRNTARLVRSLKDKKERDASGLFVVEGEKMVAEALRSGWSVEAVFALPDAELPAEYEVPAMPVSASEMEKMSLLTSPSPCLALVRKPEAPKDIRALVREHPLALAIDGVRDPGNLGTILRLADWFGADLIFASDAQSRYPTSDIYNPKVVQATMGAIFRKRVIYTSLPETARIFAEEKMEIYGTFLDGKSIYGEALSKEGLIVMGNESDGISPEMAAAVTQRLLIPPYPAGASTSESLNVATATAITLSEFRRR